MKTVGIIGGIGPESTIEYYRLIVARYLELKGDIKVLPVGDARADSYPSIIINSVDLNRLIYWMNANQLDQLTDYLADEITRLAKAGADFAALSSNTPHIVFDQLSARSPVPLISIVEAVRDAVQQSGMKRAALFGTRFTMQAGFYPEVFSRANVTLITPNEAEQNFIHGIYMGELLNNIFRPETREHLLQIADRMKVSDGIECLILGGTELPLLLRDAEHNGIPFFNTSRVHVERIVKELLA